MLGFHRATHDFIKDARLRLDLFTKIWYNENDKIMYGGWAKMRMQTIKIALRMMLCVAISFVVIYLLVFFGGWKLIESGDPILIEFAVSVIVGILLGIIVEFSKYCETKFRQMSAKIQELENRIEELHNKKS